MAFTSNQLSYPNTTPSTNTAGIVNCSVVHNSSSHRWIVDTGATNHISSTPDLLHDTQLLPTTEYNKVHLPNGQKIPIVFSGKSRLTQRDISHVLYIPDFKYNLLSVSELTKELHCCMVFYPDHCILQDLHTGKVKGTGSMENGLYDWSHIVSPTVASSVSPLVALSTLDDVDLWHRRLGHIPHKVLQQMQIPHISSSSKLTSCPICPLAKQTRLPFP